MNQSMETVNTSSKREWWVDYLRVIAVFLVIPFHVIISYVEDAMGPGVSFMIWNEPFSEGARIVFEFFNPWHMQLLFLLAGFSMVYSLRKRSFGKFIGERIIRLGIPILFGLFFLNTLMNWFSILFVYEKFPYPFVNPIYPDLPSFGMFYKNWWLQLGPIDTLGLGSMNTSHLWFLVILFVMSLIAGALVSAIKKNKKANPEKSTVVLNFLTSPAAIVFWASCSVLIKYIPALNTVGNLSAIVSVFQWNEVLFFIYGIMLAGNISSLKKLQKNWVWMLLFGFVCLVIWAVFKVDYADSLSFVRNLGAWMFVNGLIGVASKYLNKPTRTLKYFSKGSMAIYILHLPLEVIVGYYLMRNPMNPVLEIFLLILINAALCIAIYEIVRQINRIVPGIGYLLGIKEKQIWRKPKIRKNENEVTQDS